MELNWKERKGTFMAITPQIAMYWLDNHNNQNRPKSESNAEKYSRDMETGKWDITGESIIFDTNGEVIDGQTRLEAIWRSQTTQTFLVVTGVAPQVRPNVGIHRKRTNIDAIELAKLGHLLGNGSVRKTTAAGMWERIKNGVANRKGQSTRAELIDFIRAYPDGGAFALEHFGKHARKDSVTVAPTMAAVARAYYTYKDPAARAKLIRFVDVLATGIQEHKDDKVIVDLREHLTGPSQKGKNSNSQAEIYGKTTRTIQAYFQGERIARLRSPKEELFDLPAIASRAETTPILNRVAGNGRGSNGRATGVDSVAQEVLATS